MKKLIAIVSAAALMSAFAVPSFAAGKTPEEVCKARAEHKKIEADKVDEFVKSCVEKHMKKHHHHGKKEAAPAAAAPAEAPAEAPAK